MNSRLFLLKRFEKFRRL